MKNELVNGEREFVSQPNSAHPPTLVIGLGNPILGDDGIGWKVAEEVHSYLQRIYPSKSKFRESPIEVDFFSLGGLSLMERLIGYQRVIIIDAITTMKKPVGFVSYCPFDEIPEHSTRNLTAAHDTSLQNAIRVGRSLGAELPDQIMVVTIEAEKVYDFSDQLSKPVQDAVPEASRMVLEILKNWQEDLPITT